MAGRSLWPLWLCPPPEGQLARPLLGAASPGPTVHRSISQTPQEVLLPPPGVHHLGGKTRPPCKWGFVDISNEEKLFYWGASCVRGAVCRPRCTGVCVQVRQQRKGSQEQGEKFISCLQETSTSGFCHENTPLASDASHRSLRVRGSLSETRAPLTSSGKHMHLETHFALGCV